MVFILVYTNASIVMDGILARIEMIKLNNFNTQYKFTKNIKNNNKKLLTKTMFFGIIILQIK